MYLQLLQNVRVDDQDAAINYPKVQELFTQITDELGEDGRILLSKAERSRLFV